jgi:hypothetical protein
MSYNGSGTFQINTSGQPVVTGTSISSTVFNALTADLATGLSTAITKDGQTTTTARIPFALGINSTLVTDATNTTSGSIITAGGVGIAKALYVGTTANVAGAVTLGGVATFSAQPIFSSLTASSAVATDASKGLVSVTNTGTGNNVLATGPTISGPTISDGTANGVAYLNGSKVLTTGTALAFNGSKLGIGVSSFDAPLQIQAITGGTSVRFNGRASPADGYTDLAFYNSANTTQYAGIGAANSGLILATNISSPILFQTNSAEVGRFDASGNLLVGSTNNNATAGIIHAQSATNSSAVGAYAKGTTSSAVGFYCKVDSANALYAYWNCNGTPTGTISTNGTITVYGTTSDYRLKTVIGNVTGHGERIDALEPIEYTWNSNGSQTRGFLAHKFQEVYADSVTGTKDAIDADGKPTYQQMQAATSEVIADLVAEIQSLRKRLAALESA